MLCTTTVSPSRTKDRAFEFRSLCILARRLVGKQPVQLDILKLPFRILIKSADPDVSYAMTLQDASKAKSVRKKSMTYRGNCQEIPEDTLF